MRAGGGESAVPGGLLRPRQVHVSGRVPSSRTTRRGSGGCLRGVVKSQDANRGGRAVSYEGQRASGIVEQRGPERRGPRAGRSRGGLGPALAGALLLSLEARCSSRLAPVLENSRFSLSASSFQILRCAGGGWGEAGGGGAGGAAVPEPGGLQRRLQPGAYPPPLPQPPSPASAVTSLGLGSGVLVRGGDVTCGWGDTTSVTE